MRGKRSLSIQSFGTLGSDRAVAEEVVKPRRQAGVHIPIVYFPGTDAPVSFGSQEGMNRNPLGRLISMLHGERAELLAIQVQTL